MPEEYDERAEAEFNAAMHEYYERKFDVKCAACGLEQSASEHLLREIGWTLGKQEFCFRAACIRDRANAPQNCPDCKMSNADFHYNTESSICDRYERFYSEQPIAARMAA